MDGFQSGLHCAIDAPAVAHVRIDLKLQDQVNSLGAGLDQKSIEAARQTGFLPPVKERNFATYQLTVEMNFNV